MEGNKRVVIAWKRNLKYYMGIPFITNYKNIDKKIKEADIVSFDIFDTLIKRNMKRPIDIFPLVEHEFNKQYGGGLVNFQKKRIEAEYIARKSTKSEEITLREIYLNLDEKMEVQSE